MLHLRHHSCLEVLFRHFLDDIVPVAEGLSVPPVAVASFPIDNLGMALEIDLKVVHRGSSSAILGNPWESFVAAARLATKYEQEIAEGSLIMAGAATPAVYLEKGQSVQARVERLGAVSFVVG